MRPFIVLALLVITLSPAFGNQQTSQPQKQTTESQNVPSPVTVNVTQSPSQIQKENPEADAKHREEPIWSNWAIVVIAAFAAFAAIKTLRAIEAQVIEMRNTGKQTDKLIQENIAQSTSLERSVKETARFATAMEGVAESLETTAKLSHETVQGMRKQMRAYVTTGIGGAMYQERANNIRFMASPLFINNGLTPARKVKHKSKAAILPVPLPAEFDYPLPDNFVGETIMAPRQNNSVHILVDGFINDADVVNVKNVQGQGLYVWGRIEYDDIFGDSHWTIFCQLLNWLPD